MLEWYATPGPFTGLAEYAPALNALPGDVAGLSAVVQGLLVHRFWMPAYRTDPTPERERQQGLHGASAMLDAALAASAAPLNEQRAPAQRVVGICRHFAVLLCAFLRHRGVPARARCGFATYFEAGKHVDHWVCEYWDDAGSRWVMVDAQLDALQRAVVKPEFDPLDVPRDRFVVAGQAWEAVRRGEADGSKFGIADMWGSWYIRCNLFHDIAALNKVELLPWDIWKADGKESANNAALHALCDEVAPASTNAHADSGARARELYARDDVHPPEALIAAALQADVTGPTLGNPLDAKA